MESILRLCIDGSLQKDGGWIDADPRATDEACTRTITRFQGGYAAKRRCVRPGGLTFELDSRVEGNLVDHYTVANIVRVDAPPIGAGVPESRYAVEFRYVGPCPATLRGGAVPGSRRVVPR